MAFVPRLSTTSPTEMHGSPWWYSSGNGFYARGYGLPNCTCYAYGRAAEINGSFDNLNVPSRGDAGTWWKQANDAHYATGQTPQLGAIACYGENPNRRGHVCVVEQIFSNGDITVSESGWNAWYFHTARVTAASDYRQNWVINYGYQLQGFIYPQGSGPAPIPTVGSDYVIAAICGNFTEESTLNPNIWENLDGPYPYDYYKPNANVGFGLAGFTNTAGGQYMVLKEMADWCTNHGYSDLTIGDPQLDYVFSVPHWQSPSTSDYSSFYDFLNAQYDPSQWGNDDMAFLDHLTEEFMRHWEVAVSSSLLNRQQHARECYDLIQAHKNDDPSLYNTWVNPFEAHNPTLDYLSGSDYLNNLMMIYFWITNGSPVPPTPPTPGPSPTDRKPMPLWMMLNYRI